MIEPDPGPELPSRKAEAPAWTQQPGEAAPAPCGLS